MANIKFSNDILETIFSLINLINFSKNKNMDKFFLNRLNRYILDFVSYLFIINDFKNNFKNCEISLKKKFYYYLKKNKNSKPKI